jgi:hypothetical protein
MIYGGMTVFGPVSPEKKAGEARQLSLFDEGM